MSFSVSALSGARWVRDTFEPILSSNASMNGPFRYHLSGFIVGSHDRRECVDNCLVDVKNRLRDHNYGYSESGIQEITSVIVSFELAVAESSCSYDEILPLKSEFRELFVNLVEDRWSVDSAESFYAIPTISDKQEQAVVARRWTHQYFEALTQLDRWRGSRRISEEYVTKFTQKTAGYFYMHALQVSEKKMAEMYVLMEKDPTSFHAVLDRVIEKAAKDPESLSSLEQEYLAFMKNMASSVTMYWPNIDRGAFLLHECAWLGFSQREKNCAPSLKESHSSFAAIFRESE